MRKRLSLSWRTKLDHRAALPLKREESNATVMIKNVPNKRTRELFMEFLDQHCKLENRKAVNAKADQE